MDGRRLLLLFLAVALLAPACQAVKKHSAQATRSARLNLDRVKADVRDFHESGGYQARVEKSAADLTGILRARADSPGPAAVVFDLDETLLSNYLRLADRDFAFAAPVGSARDVKAISAGLSTPAPPILPAIESMHRAFDLARNLGYSIFLVSERPESLRRSTERNLYEAGYAGYARLVLAAPELAGKPARHKGNARSMIEQEGFDIVATVGDQDSDFAQGPTGVPVRVVNDLYEESDSF